MLKIRLSRIGRKKTPIYRLVVVDGRNRRDSMGVEQVGHYNPRGNKELLLKRDRIEYWLAQGAKPSETVAELLKRVG